MVPVPLTTTININHDQPLLPSGNLTGKLTKWEITRG